MADQMNNILEKMKEMKDELDYIKENMVEKDEIMTLKEYGSYKKSHDKKNLVSLKDAKKELGML